MDAPGCEVASPVCMTARLALHFGEPSLNRNLPSPLASLEKVGRRLGKSLTVADVSLDLFPGMVTALLGPSGSGKSTLLRMIAGLEPVDAGEIRAEGRLLNARNVHVDAERRGMGVVFQDYALFPHMSVLENVLFGISGHPKERAHSSAMQGLEDVGLAHRARDYPHQLSGGEQQRVAIARALVPGPSVILLDEPFAGLDPALRVDLRQLLLGRLIRDGAAVLLVTHDAEEAMRTADRVALMRQGQIVQQGPMADVYSNPVDFRAATALGPVAVVAANVRGGLAHSAIGAFPARSQPDGPARVFCREEAFGLSPRSEVRARVLAVRRTGAHLAVNLRLLSSGEVVEALLDRRSGVTPDAEVGLDVDADLTWVWG